MNRMQPVQAGEHFLCPGSAITGFINCGLRNLGCLWQRLLSGAERSWGWGGAQPGSPAVCSLPVDVTHQLITG